MPWPSQILMHGRSMLIARPRKPSVGLQGHFHRLMWPERVIATSNQHWARARSVVGLSGPIGQPYQKLHRASVSRVGTHGWAGISRRQIEGRTASVGLMLHRLICRDLRECKDVTICLSRRVGRETAFSPPNSSRMIKIALGVYDTREITEHDRLHRRADRSFASRSGRLSSAIPSYRSVTTLDARGLPTFN